MYFNPTIFDSESISITLSEDSIFNPYLVIPLFPLLDSISEIEKYGELQC